ncbi:MAG: discoidin domain-containing protein, partial [Actinomycetes bacterium]
YRGLSALYSPVSPGFTLFPEHRPFAALDGNLNTSWITDEKDPGRQYMQMDLIAPLAVGRIRVWPHRDFGGNTTRLLVSVNGGLERAFRLHKGWNSVPINNPALKSLRLRVPGTKNYYGETPEGIDEVSIPGLHVTEALRLPTRLASIASGQALTRSPIDVVLERVTADFPFRAGKSTGVAFGLDPVEMADAEPGLRRLVSLPTARRFVASGWAAVAATAPDSAIDTLVGMGTANHYDSSNRFEGVPINRASSAFDGNPRTAWITEYNGFENPSIRWHGMAEIPVRRIILHRLPGNFLNPLRVTVATPLGGFDLPVRAGGEVLLPVAVTTNQLTITIRAVRRPRTIRKGERAPKAIALSSIDVPGLPAATPERVGRFDSGCGAASVSAHGRSMPLAVVGDVRALDSGRALAFTSCGSRSWLDLSKGSNLVSVNPGPIFTVDSIRLHGAAVSRPGPITVGMTGISPGGKVSLSGPGWLVLGQSYSPGWRAWCTDHSGAEHDLGSPRQIDGFANGWPIEGSSCASARFAFGPQLYANIGYWISGLAALMILALLALRAWRRRDRSSETEDQNDPHPSRAVQLRTASGLSLTVAQAGAPPAAAAGGWRRGRVSQVLFGFALAAVIVAGLLYVLKPNASAQGINFDYPLAHTTEHWIALAAMVALAAGAVVDFVGQTRCRRDGS